MDRKGAAHLLAIWISFNGMDDEESWEGGYSDAPVWPRVQNTRRAIEYAIQLLLDRTVMENINHERAVDLMETWPKYIGMDDPTAWGAETYPLVRSCMYAIEFAVEFLKTHQRHLLSIVDLSEKVKPLTQDQKLALLGVLIGGMADETKFQQILLECVQHLSSIEFDELGKPIPRGNIIQ